MKILFLHGWTSIPGGRKPTYLRERGHTIINPALPDHDFAVAVRITEDAHRQNDPDVILGSSRGGAVAVNMRSEKKTLVLLCPAWKHWGSASVVQPNTLILHARNDEVVGLKTR